MDTDNIGYTRRRKTKQKQNTIYVKIPVNIRSNSITQAHYTLDRSEHTVKAFICISSYHDSWNLLNSTINTNNLNEQKKTQLFILYIHNICKNPSQYSFKLDHTGPLYIRQIRAHSERVHKLYVYFIIYNSKFIKGISYNAFLNQIPGILRWTLIDITLYNIPTSKCIWLLAVF
jgi:hypothetical protein